MTVINNHADGTSVIRPENAELLPEIVADACGPNIGMAPDDPGVGLLHRHLRTSPPPQPPK